MIQNFSKYKSKFIIRNEKKKKKKKGNCLYNHGVNFSKKICRKIIGLFWVLFLSTKPFKCLIIIYTAYIFIPPNLGQKQTHLKSHNNFPNKHVLSSIKFNCEFQLTQLVKSLIIK